MNLEDLMISQISQSQKDKYCYVSTRVRHPSAVKFMEAESRVVASRDWVGVVDGELVFDGCRVLVGEDEKLLEKDGADGTITTWMYLMPLKNG